MEAHLPAMNLLKLAAMDREDLTIVSAHIQDAVIRAPEIRYWPGERQIVLPLRRYVREDQPRLPWKKAQRRLSVLQFDRVRAVRYTGFDPHNDASILNALALVCEEKGEGPDVLIRLICSGDAAIELDAEYVEARLADLGAAWQTGNRPVHPG